MVYVVAKNFVKEGKVREFYALAKLLEKETNEKDTGCIKYVLVRDKNNPNTFAYIEEWESQETLDNHTKAKHCTEIGSKLYQYLEKPGEVSFFTDSDNIT
ncbi:MAG: hypothetical protein A2Y17_03395 [Clostridiales bacterium GWF2_38_85]|nr:MAG: hypothetical protein A2Y17_03395 [Clostridiales bacterium GWF2_38_85]HBL85252.1 antibiotic biosynthesis monooxygenase [Clostridiales bacterium]